MRSPVKKPGLQMWGRGDIRQQRLMKDACQGRGGGIVCRQQKQPFWSLVLVWSAAPKPCVSTVFPGAVQTQTRLLAERFAVFVGFHEVRTQLQSNGQTFCETFLLFFREKVLRAKTKLKRLGPNND